jgi:hypothetical protein
MLPSKKKISHVFNVENNNYSNLKSAIEKKLNITKPQYYFPFIDLVNDNLNEINKDNLNLYNNLCLNNTSNNSGKSSNDNNTNTLCEDSDNYYLKSKYLVYDIQYIIDEDMEDADNRIDILDANDANDTAVDDADDANAENNEEALEYDEYMKSAIPDTQLEELVDLTIEKLDQEDQEDDNMANTEDDNMANTEDDNMADTESDDIFNIENPENNESVKRHIYAKCNKLDDADEILNCFSIYSNIIEDNDPDKITTAKIFCKKSPLLEPIKFVGYNFAENEESEFINPDKTTEEYSITKLNDINNSSFVEASLLYLNSKLTEEGKCPTFPYFYGTVNGLSKVYYHNINDEYPTLKNEQWFIDKTNTSNIDLCYIDLDELESENSDDESENLLSDNESGDDSGDDSDDNDRDVDDENGDDNDDIEEDNKSLLTDVSDLEELDTNELDSTYLDLENNKQEDIKSKCKDEILLSIDNGNFEFDEDEEDDVVFLSQFEDSNQQNELDDDDENNNDDTKLLLEHISKPYTNKNDGGDCDYDGDSNDKDNINPLDEDCESLDLSDLDLEEVLENQIHQKNNNNKTYFLRLKNYPVNVCFMEKMKYTLDDMLDEGYNMSENEWLSVLFQTTFGLAVANKHYNFVHNDLHSDNIMFQETNKTHLYYQINKSFYKIPTYGKITKIIDFARGICKYNNKWIFSDVFHPEGEAAGQYDYPKNAKSLKGCKNKPNPSFDLIRLATTISERLDYNSPVYELINKWCECDDGSNVLHKEDDFDLYIDIAQNCHNAVPREVLKDEIFAQFKCNKADIPDATHIYKL